MSDQFLNHLTKTATAEIPKTERPQHLSAEPRVCLEFFPQLNPPPHPVPFHCVGNSPGIFQPAPHAVSFDWVGISQYLSTKPYSVSRPGVGMPQMFHLHPTPPVSFLLGGGRQPAPLPNKTQNLNQYGRFKTRRDIPTFVCTPRGGEWTQGATAGTKAPVPHGVQLKEGSPLWVPSWLP